MVAFHRIFVIDFAGLGLGEAPDANRFQSVGTDTLGHVAVSWSGKLNLPTLQRLGLGNIRVDHPLLGINPVATPLGFYGRLHMAAEDNQSATGLREMWDYNGRTRTQSVLATLSEAGYPVTIAAPFTSYLQTQDAAEKVQLGSNKEAFRVLNELLYRPASGMSLIVLPDFQFAGEHGDTTEFGEVLQHTDEALGQIIHDMGVNDLLIVTASEAVDPTVAVTPTREYLPVIAYSASRPSTHALGIRRTLADVGATVLENFGLAAYAAGHSFLNEFTQ
ncbi:phosphopentomutase [Levilactobacillus tujiorum]|uniref:phosphopentomutase n=1 Tax=Levilactobacillus tujiorum TaxID=2912243 RepID=UPI001B3B225F|nr:phosphopentomutase [Levilactobacillus tujiorum]MCH5465162.1 phosphopentomutase [Levilactobacillus tujiorum]